MSPISDADFWTQYVCVILPAWHAALLLQLIKN